MSDYTPDEEQVREQYTREQPPQIGTVAEKHAEFDRFIARVKAEAAVEALKRLEFECESIALSIGGHNLNGAVTLRDTARTVAVFRARIEKEAGL